MGENVLIGLAAIIVFGIFAQWFSWILRLPSILLLLVLGFIAGPVTGLLNPDEFFGELLFPFVSISVAIILFEGGLSFKDFGTQAGTIRCKNFNYNRDYYHMAAYYFSISLFP